MMTSAEFIPMKPDGETIFDEPFIESENSNITFSRDEWVAAMQEVHNTMLQQWGRSNGIIIPHPKLIINIDFLGDRITGFMTAPTAKLGTLTLTAAARKTASLDDIVELFKQTQGKIYLYMIQKHYPSALASVPPHYTVRSAEIEE